MPTINTKDNTKNATHVIILAAGKGSRMRSAKPKVLAKLANKPLLAHVLETAKQITQPEHIHIVIGHGANEVKSEFSAEKVSWCSQKQQLGTGDAVKSAIDNIPGNSNVLILYGDVPLINISTLTPLLDKLNNSDICILTAELNDATGYGRITRDPNQRVNGIVEHKDASEEQLLIDEINSGILAANTEKLKQWLAKVEANNKQNEYYLTDVVGIAYNTDTLVSSEKAQQISEISGVNSRVDLANLERVLQLELANEFMSQGLTISDPSRFDVRGELEFGMDCFIDINVVFNGNVILGNNVQIHANCILSDCMIADNSVIHPNSVLEECRIGEQVNIGPFARVRPGSELQDQSRIGNFVELKKTILGKGSKVNHLSYVGDSEVGENTNIGAGVITCNYDGANKYKTVIGDNAFIGSNAQLIAPVVIESDATIAAGSTITVNVPSKNLAVARSKQKNLAGWQRQIKKT